MIHIHNGDVVLAMAKRSGIPGEHTAFRESLITGAVVPGEDWIETRAQALVDGHGGDLLRVRTDLLEQEQALADASHGEIVLWFEHDLYCLIHLVYLLQRLAEARLSLVWWPTPIGQNEDDLSLLFASRTAVTPPLIDVARQAWGDYTSPDPSPLNRWLAGDSPELPFLREGLALHASRFPSMRNGLGVIENRALQSIASGVADFASIFDRINTEVPRLGFGDSEVARLLRGMATRAVPLIVESGEPPTATFGITPTGEDVLRGEIDDTAINDPDAWLGGARLTRQTPWRWDDDARAIVSRHPRLS